MQFCVLMKKIDKRRDAKGKHLAFTYVTKNNEREAIFVGADECFCFPDFSYAADAGALHYC